MAIISVPPIVAFSRVAPINWRRLSPPETNSWMSMAANGVTNGSTVIALASSGTTYTMRSVDGGRTWAAVAASENAAWRGITYTNYSNNWVAVASSGTNRVMRTVDNGATWTGVSVAANAWFGIATGASNRVVSVANSGTDRIMYSTDRGATWVPVVGYDSVAYNGIAYGAATFVAVGNSGAILTSADEGVTWTARTSGITDHILGVTYGNGIFVAVAQGGKVLKSSDGSTWTRVLTIAGSVSVKAAAYTNGVWVFLQTTNTTGGRHLHYSIDNLASYKSTFLPDAGQQACIVAMDGYFIALSSTGTNRAFISDMGEF